MKTPLWVGASLALTLTVAAEPVTVEFSGTVIETRRIEEFGPGARLSGYYVFEPAPDADRARPTTRQDDPLLEASISVSGNVYVVDRGTVTAGSGEAASPVGLTVVAGPPVAGAALSGLVPHQLKIAPDRSLIPSLEDDPLATPPAGPGKPEAVDGWIVFQAAEGEGEGLVTFSVDRFFVMPSGAAVGQGAR